MTYGPYSTCHIVRLHPLPTSILACVRTDIINNEEDYIQSYLETCFESFADHVQSDGVDAGVKRCHINANIVQDKKHTEKDERIRSVTQVSNTYHN